MYCHQTDPPRRPQGCGSFLGRRTGKKHCRLCEKCQWYTCLLCLECYSTSDSEGKEIEIEHHYDPSSEQELRRRAFEGLVRGRDYQDCPNTNCEHRIELSEGCNCIQCQSCGMQFCYIRGRKAEEGSGHWKSGSRCPKWNQPASGNALFHDDRDDDDRGDDAGLDYSLALQMEMHRLQEARVERVRRLEPRIWRLQQDVGRSLGVMEEIEASVDLNVAREVSLCLHRLDDWLRQNPHDDDHGVQAAEDAIGAVLARLRHHGAEDHNRNEGPSRAQQAALLQRATRAPSLVVENRQPLAAFDEYPRTQDADFQFDALNRRAAAAGDLRPRMRHFDCSMPIPNEHVVEDGQQELTDSAVRWYSGPSRGRRAWEDERHGEPGANRPSRVRLQSLSWRTSVRALFTGKSAPIGGPLRTHRHHR